MRLWAGQSAWGLSQFVPSWDTWCARRFLRHSGPIQTAPGWNSAIKLPRFYLQCKLWILPEFSNFSFFSGDDEDPLLSASRDLVDHQTSLSFAPTATLPDSISCLQSFTPPHINHVSVLPFGAHLPILQKDGCTSAGFNWFWSTNWKSLIRVRKHFMKFGIFFYQKSLFKKHSSFWNVFRFNLLKNLVLSLFTSFNCAWSLVRDLPFWTKDAFFYEVSILKFLFFKFVWTCFSML